MMTGAQLKALRKRIGLSQQIFWDLIGVKQSSGSRYESDQYPLPAPIELLVAIVYKQKPPPKAPS